MIDRRFRLLMIGLLMASIAFVSSQSDMTAPARAAGNVSGVIFRDFNANGQRDPNEPQVGGVTVTAYDASGAAQGSVISVLCTGNQTAIDALGAAASAAVADGCTASDSGANYTLTTTGTGPYRIEFTDWPSYLEPGAQGTNSNSSVQFVAEGGSTHIDFGLNDPARYCQQNPNIATTCFVAGDFAGTFANGTVVLDFPYESGTAADPAPAGNQPVGAFINGAYALDARASDVGSVWGLAYQRGSQSLFAASFTKRHAGFGPTGNPGTIYLIDKSVAVPNATAFYDVNAGVDNRTAADKNADYFVDNTTFNNVGRLGLGDIEIARDEQTLYVVNLFSNQLHALQIGPDPGSTPVVDTAFAMPQPTTGVNATVGCAAAETRSGALGYHDGTLYVGLTCTGPAISDLRAYVYSFDGATFGAQPVAEFALNYDRGFVSTGFGSAPAAWQPWATDSNNDPRDDITFFAAFGHYYYPQPWLLDIEFDEYGFMITSLADRLGHQSGNDKNGASAGNFEGISAGDLLRFAPDRASGTWLLENNGSVGVGLPGGGTRTASPGASESPDQGPGGDEFYFSDSFNNLFVIHEEIFTGGVFQLHGSGEIVASAFDPSNADSQPVRAGGLIYSNNADGSRARSVMLFQQDDPGTFGKAAGVGDIEALCNAAPVEIGNYVWLDTDRDGVQDPDEQPLAGITVQIFDANGTLIGTAITDAQGRYYFSNDPNGTSSSSAVYGLPFTPGAGVTISIDLTQPALTPYTLTLGNIGGAGGDARDSDGVISGTVAIIPVVIGAPGENNHTYDYGFHTPPTAIELVDFTAKLNDDETAVEIAWQTGSEVDSAGFALYRGTSEAFGEAELLTAEPIAATGGLNGASYAFSDTTANPERVGEYRYWLRELTYSGTTHDYGPFRVGNRLSNFFERIFLPLLRQ